MKVTVTRYSNGTFWISNEKKMVRFRLPDSDLNIPHYEAVYHTAVKDGYLDIQHAVEVEDEGVVYKVYQEYTPSGTTKTIIQYDLDYNNIVY